MAVEEVEFEATATPNFPTTSGRWAMVWMGTLAEVPAVAHSYQVPFYSWASEQELQDKVDEIGALAQAAHPGCQDVKVVVSRGSGQWEGMAAIHAEGSL
jgi:hypothetical protein